MLAVPEPSPELDMKTVLGLGLSEATLTEGRLAAMNDGWLWLPQAVIVDAVAKTTKDVNTVVVLITQSPLGQGLKFFVCLLFPQLPRA
jgi:hypothetical protein